MPCGGIGGYWFKTQTKIYYNVEDRNVWYKLTANNKTNFVGVKLSVLVIDGNRKYIMNFTLGFYII